MSVRRTVMRLGVRNSDRVDLELGTCLVPLRTQLG
jgi:hypothetical protein